MYVVTDVPRTLTGKKMEVPVRKILMGWPLDKAASRDAMANPETIDYFVRFAEESLDYQWRSFGSSQLRSRERPDFPDGGAKRTQGQNFRLPAGAIVRTACVAGDRLGAFH